MPKGNDGGARDRASAGGSDKSRDKADKGSKADKGDKGSKGDKGGSRGDRGPRDRVDRDRSERSGGRERSSGKEKERQSSDRSRGTDRSKSRDGSREQTKGDRGASSRTDRSREQRTSASERSGGRSTGGRSQSQSGRGEQRSKSRSEGQQSAKEKLREQNSRFKEALDKARKNPREGQKALADLHRDLAGKSGRSQMNTLTDSRRPNEVRVSFTDGKTRTDFTATRNADGSWSTEARAYTDKSGGQPVAIDRGKLPAERQRDVIVNHELHNERGDVPVGISDRRVGVGGPVGGRPSVRASDPDSIHPRAEKERSLSALNEPDRPERTPPRSAAPPDPPKESWKEPRDRIDRPDRSRREERETPNTNSHATPSVFEYAVEQYSEYDKQGNTKFGYRTGPHPTKDFVRTFHIDRHPLEKGGPYVTHINAKTGVLKFLEKTRLHPKLDFLRTAMKRDVLRGLGVAGAVAGLAIDAVQIVDADPDDRLDVVTGLSVRYGGAAFGAAVGTVALGPGVGTIIGGAVGEFIVDAIMDNREKHQVSSSEEEP